ncbi:hypothetical protein EZS27_009346 [termite gut metagenome]|uniref:Uncharacterized protein n=1 Tax=termite gut metagenome TaxID=433724 RepID=A0A5J4SCG3_9ZZZZ
MKIEIGESVIVSWLKHVIRCQLVQTNWKASSGIKNVGDVGIARKIWNTATNAELYPEFDGIFKNSSFEQSIRQAEIDAIGVYFSKGQNKIYAGDVAYHEGGLNYGDTEETITRIAKKYLRTVMCLVAHFGIEKGEIFFASPKINKNLFTNSKVVTDGLNGIINSLNKLCTSLNLQYTIKLYYNNVFYDEIISPLDQIMNDIADTGELYIRSMQLHKLSSGFASTSENIQRQPKPQKNATTIVADQTNYIKIGELVKTTFKFLLENGAVTNEEIEQMQTLEYSKRVFDLQYPVLNKQRDPLVRYYAQIVYINGEKYYICSQWFEASTNNDRPFLEKWIEEHLALI